MIAICLGQAIMSVNVASLPVAMSGMVESFGVPPTTVATGIVVHNQGGRRAEIEAESPFRVASPSLTLTNLLEVARRLVAAFADGIDGSVVIQGTDTIEGSAFMLDLLVAGDKPVVVPVAMRGADSLGADGPANLLATALVAAAPASRGLGTMVVLNYDVHAARFVQKSHTALPSAFLSPLMGPIGTVIEGRPRYYSRIARHPCHPTAA